MRPIGKVFSLLVLAFALPALAHETTPRPIVLAQAATCQSWHQTCVKRCQTTLPGDTTCPKVNCGPKLATCKSTGCWQQGQAFGGGQVCNLAK